MPVLAPAQAAVDHWNVETQGKPRCLHAGQVVVGTSQNESHAGERRESQVRDFTIVRSPLCIGERGGEGSAQSRCFREATVAAVKEYGPGKIGGFDDVGIDYDGSSRAQQAQILQNLIAKRAASD